MEAQMVEEGKTVDERPRETELRKPQSRTKAILVLLGGGLFLALVAGGLWLHYRYRVSSDDAQVDGHIVPISGKVFGSVLEVTVNDNQQMKAGDVLVRIDPRDLQAKLDQEKAALALAESQAQAAHVTVPLTRDTTHSGTSGASAGSERLRGAGGPGRCGGCAGKHGPGYRAFQPLGRRSQQREGASGSGAHASAGGQGRDLAAGIRFLPAAAKVTAAQLKAAQDRLRYSEQGIATAHAAADAARAKVQQMRAEVAQSTAGERQVLVSSAQAVSAVARVQEARANVAAAALNLSYTTIVAPGRWRGYQENGGARPDRAARPGPDGDHSVEGRMGDGQLQGNAIGQRARRPASRDQGGHVWPNHRGESGFHRRRHWRALEPAAARRTPPETTSRWWSASR